MYIKTDLDCQYPAIGSTDLWQLLKKKVLKADLSADFLEAVGKVCIHGITLSKDIIRFFPTFTLHDETHIANVCNWIMRLLGDERDKLSVYEAALLVMAACCHDIGMSVSISQESTLAANPESLEWKRYFEGHYSDDEEFSKTGIISKRMLRNYVRLNHHRLVKEKLNAIEWPKNLLRNHIPCSVVISLCQSHGQELEMLSCPQGMPYDLRLCAVLLRIADILDFDPSRAPVSLFKQFGLEHPDDFETKISQTEWAKNRSGVFGIIKNRVIPFTASFTDLQLEYEVRSYLDWVRQELIRSSEYLSKYTGNWQDFRLPREISTDSVERKGYQFGRFCLTLDQDQVLTLFAGENLYGDPCVFVRELLQNAFDAVLLRSVLDANFAKQDGKITIYSWTDCKGNDWFRIEDNGIGMDENIITNYFLTVGRSYYTSEAFRAEKRHYASGTDYMPISRFGIGILSCFMSDPENTLLEVSTRRYSHDQMRPNPAIRMNVTGLHGYYYLVQEDEQSDNDDLFQSMHHPQNTDLGYRKETGTTICVQVNLAKMRTYQSFKEILDKYICFPEIQIEYYGSEGYVIYPTKKELMDSVHALNSNLHRELRDYRHPISEAQFTELKKALPNVIWKETPSIVLKYLPLDWFSSAENLSGATVYAHIEALGEVVPLVCGDEKVSFLLGFNLKNNISSEEILLEFSIWCKKEEDHNKRFKKYWKKIMKYKKEHSFSISYKDLLLQMNKDETAAFQYIMKRSHLASDINVIAYRGIIVDASNALGMSENCWASALLLDGVYRPEASLSRNTITGLPLEAACDIAIMLKVMKHDSFGTLGIWKLINVAQFPTLTEQRLQQLLDDHPYLEEWLKYIDRDYYTLFIPDYFHTPYHSLSLSRPPVTYQELYLMFENCEIMGMEHFDVNSLYHWIWLTAVKRHTDIFKKAPDTSKFPVVLFCMQPLSDGPLGLIRSGTLLNYYNSFHPFSRWLIQYQDTLQAQVPVLYTHLINTMIWGKSCLEVTKTINDILIRLKGFNRNPFGISDMLFLEESSFQI